MRWRAEDECRIAKGEYNDALEDIEVYRVGMDPYAE